MSVIKGIVVDLEIGLQGTDDHIYIGVVGTGGGREFSLASENFDDFEANSETTYAFGNVWEGQAISGPDVRNPKNSIGGNTPLRRYPIELDDVTQVYIRKGGTRSGDGDDECDVNSVVVRLYGEPDERRRFVVPYREFLAGPPVMVMSNESGHQYWLVEENTEPFSVRSSG